MRTAREIPTGGCFEGHERAFRRAFVRHYPAVRRLAALDPRAAQLLMLHQLGLSHAEIAEIVDVAPGSIGTLLTRAKRAFISTYKRRDRRAAEGTSR